MTWLAENELRLRLRDLESQWVERKQSAANRGGIRRNICAFAAATRISEQITGRWKSSTSQHNTIAFQIKHIDLRAYKSLRGSPLAMDIYT